MRVKYSSNNIHTYSNKKKVLARDFFFFKNNMKNLDDNINLKNDHTLLLKPSSTYIVKFSLKIKCKTNTETFIGIINNNHLVESFMENGWNLKLNRTLNVELSTIIVTPFNENANVQFINLGGDITVQNCDIIINKVI